MSEEIVLREYRAGDVEAMFRLDEACFAEAFRFDRRSMRRFAEEERAVSIVAEAVAGEMAGFVIVQVEDGVGYVVTLDVAETFRRGGLGARLLQAAEERAGVEVMALHVSTGNLGAIRFYERLGYELLGMQKGFYGAGGDAFVYRKGTGGGLR